MKTNKRWSDEEVDILKSYGNKIKWISEPDSGQSEAINKGFKMVTGDIVTWLNADDYYQENIFNKISREFTNNEKLVLLYGNCRSVDEEYSCIKINTPPSRLNYKKLIRGGNYIYQPSSFYKTDAVKKNNYLDEKLNYWMEYDLFIKLLKSGESKHINITLSNFTIRRDQKSDIRNIIEMDKELISISRKYGGARLSKIYFSTIIHKVISFFRK